MRNLVKSSRILLIELGKFAPFLICFLVFVSYIESLYAIVTNDYLVYEDCYVLNKPVSWFIGKYLTYNITTVFVLAVVSVSVETCIWNKLCVVYLALQLVEKKIYMQVELEEHVVLLIILINIIVMFILLVKGVSQLVKTI